MLTILHPADPAHKAVDKFRDHNGRKADEKAEEHAPTGAQQAEQKRRTNVQEGIDHADKADAHTHAENHGQEFHSAAQRPDKEHQHWPADDHFLRARAGDEQNQYPKSNDSAVQFYPEKVNTDEPIFNYDGEIRF